MKVTHTDIAQSMWFKQVDDSYNTSLVDTYMVELSLTEIFDHLSPDHFPSCLFSYDELKASTRNFHRGNKIGEGTFGAVYKVDL